MHMKKRVSVIGAGGSVGLEITRLLRARGNAVLATYRTPRQATLEAFNALGAEHTQLDLSDSACLQKVTEASDDLIAVPILSKSATLARYLRSDQCAVFFSSQNVEVDPHAEVYRALLAAEQVVARARGHRRILRPTMIYGYPGDGNLSSLMMAMRKWPVLPLPGGGTAKQQPVYYKDVAAAALVALDEMGALKASDDGSDLKGEAGHLIKPVAGPDIVSQRALYRLVGESIAKTPRLLPLPLRSVSSVLRVFERAGLRLPVSSAQLRRACLDKTPRQGSAQIGPTSLREGLQYLATALDDQPSGT